MGVSNEVYDPKDIITLCRETIEIRNGEKDNRSLSLFTLAGIYCKNQEARNYAGRFYDKVKSEYDNYEIKLIVPFQLREKLINGSLVHFRGTLSKECKPSGTIELMFNVTSFDKIKDETMSDKEMALLSLLQKKSSMGYRNIDKILESIIYRDNKPKVCLLFAAGSITDADFQSGVSAAASHIDFLRENVSFQQISRFIEMIRSLDNRGFDIIAIIRGGGSGISEVFGNPDLIETFVNMKTPLICGVGHPKEEPFIGKIADKDLETPSLLGVYFRDLVNRTIEERTQSKAILLKEVEKQFKDRIMAQQKHNDELTQKIKIQNEESAKMCLEIKQTRESHEKQAKELNKTLADMQATTKSLQRDLGKVNAEKNQSLTDLNNAKIRVFELEQQLKTARRLNEKKGGCFGVLITIVGILSVACYALFVLLK